MSNRIKLDELREILIQEQKLADFCRNAETTRNLAPYHHDGCGVSDQPLPCQVNCHSQEIVPSGHAGRLPLPAPNSVLCPVWEKVTYQRRRIVLKKIEQELVRLVEQIAQDKPPSLSYDSRDTWHNIRFSEGTGLQMKPNTAVRTIKFDAIQSVNKFALTVKLLGWIYKLLQTDTYCTKRELYYRAPQLFGSQAQLDDIVDNISCMLQTPRWHLNVLATSKGLIAGALQFKDNEGTVIECSVTSTGVPVPNHVTAITELSSQASFVLVVEKDATFQTLLDQGFCWKMAPCILLTGKGVPDVNSRLLVRKLWDELHIPILLLVDADPHGIEILSIYKYGSRSLAYEAEYLTVPAVRWLGVLPTDIQRYNITPSVMLPMTSSDSDKARELLKRPYFSTNLQWRHELEHLIQEDKKAEIQCLTAISCNFLTDCYLPIKIRAGDWI